MFIVGLDVKGVFLEKEVFEWVLAGHPVFVSFLDRHTRFHLRPAPKRVLGCNPQLSVTPELLEEGRRYLPPDSSDAYIEYRCLISQSARLLLGFHCSVFHAAAFFWRGRAWLLTAPSGTGKTTQYLNWQRLFPGEIQMISGDMPILESREDGSVWVHPSSWNGKENIFGAPAASLGGLVLLQQGKEDCMEVLAPHDAVIPLLRQFMVIPETEQEIRELASLLERVLLSVPCRKFVNLGGDDSTRLLRDTFSCFLDQEA